MPAMSLVDSSGASIKPEVQLTKLKLHTIEIPVPTKFLDLSQEEILAHCQQPSLMQLQIAPGQVVYVIKGLTIGINGAEAMIVIETSRALDGLRAQIDELRTEMGSEIDELRYEIDELSKKVEE